MLELDHVILADAAGRRLLEDVSLRICRGEVLGIAGVEGNGQTELTEVVMGMRQPTSGRVELHDADITELVHAAAPRVRDRLHPRGPAAARPAARRAAVGEPDPGPPEPQALRQGIWLDRAGARTDSQRIVEGYDVRTPSIDTSARALSGGNQQKFIVGREMSGDPVLLVASHPTRGVDVGAQAAIWDHIRDARRRGLAVLLISADLDELIGLSDSIKVILRGRFVGDFDPHDVTPQDLGSAMTGAADSREDS